MPAARHEAALSFERLALLLSVCSSLAACSLNRLPHGSSSKHATTHDGGSVAIDTGAGADANGGGAGNAGGESTAGNGAIPGQDAGASSGSLGDAGPTADAALDAAPQGYDPGSVGAPCTADNECKTDRMTRTCFTETKFAPLLTLPGGYCGKLCDLSVSYPCETGATCITLPTLPPIPVCMRACTKDSDCRVQDGYSCNKPFTSNTSVCSLRN